MILSSIELKYNTDTHEWDKCSHISEKILSTTVKGIYDFISIKETHQNQAIIQVVNNWTDTTLYI